MRPGQHDIAGPKLGIRWLRVAAGLCLGAAVATQVERHLVPASPSPAWPSPGISAPGGRPAIATGCPAACAARPSGCLSGSSWRPLVVYVASWTRLVRHQQRLRPELGRRARQPHARLVHHRLLVPVQPLDAAVRPRPVHLPVLQVQPARLARPGPADLVLLVRGQHAELPHAGQHGVGSAGHRHAADLVGRHAGAAVLPGLVAHRADRRPGLSAASRSGTGEPARCCSASRPAGCRGSGTPGTTTAPSSTTTPSPSSRS